MYDRDLGAAPKQKPKDSAPLFPLFVNLAGRHVTVVGGGFSSVRRIRALIKFGADIKIIAPDLCPEAASLVREGRVSWLQSKFSPPFLEGSDLVIASADIRDVNKLVGETAKRMQILVCVADSREESSFCFPAIVQNESVVAGIISLDDDFAAVKNIVQKLCRRFGKDRGR